MNDDARLSTKDQFYFASLTKAMTSTLVAIVIADGDRSLAFKTTIPDVPRTRLQRGCSLVILSFDICHCPFHS